MLGEHHLLQHGHFEKHKDVNAEKPKPLIMPLMTCKKTLGCYSLLSVESNAETKLRTLVGRRFIFSAEMLSKCYETTDRRKYIFGHIPFVHGWIGFHFAAFFFSDIQVHLSDLYVKW